MQPFDEVVAEHGAVVLRVCRALLGPVDADDAWSDTFLSAMAAYATLPPDSNVRGWLTTIAHNRSIDHMRRTNRQPEPADHLPESATSTEPNLGDDELRAAVAALPDKQRRAVVYRYLADLSYRDIAELLDCTEAAARRSAADGVARLRQIYPKGQTS
jgi:RNA polymerase sigma factor (sigma-70 family)